MKRFAILMATGSAVALCVLTQASISAAKTPAAPAADDPVMAAYREYKAAVAHADAVGAEAAAGRALALSEARDGGGGVTAVLAMNLALARLDLKRPVDVIAPARRALELARSGAKGVDELQARLILDDALLSTSPNSDETDMVGALREAGKRGSALDDYAYPAAITLSHVAAKNAHWLNLIEASRAAQQHISAASGNHPLAEAEALVTEGLGQIALREDEKADIVLTRALKILIPITPEDSAGTDITFGELTLAEAEMLRATERSRQFTEQAKSFEPESWEDGPGLPGKPAVCEGHLSVSPLPDFPEASRKEGGIGAVVVRVRMDARGSVTGSSIIAAFPSEDFRKSVSNPALRWSFKPSANAKPGCRLETNDRRIVVKFVLG